MPIEKITVTLTERERMLLSDALCRYIKDTSEARAAFCMDKTAFAATVDFVKELQKLNTKICNPREEDNE